MSDRTFYIDVLATRKDGPLYIGMTDDRHRRVFEHKTHAMKGYTARYNVDRPVDWEQLDTADVAIAREKRLKRWRREWKVALVEKTNPDWADLAEASSP